MGVLSLFEGGLSLFGFLLGIDGDDAVLGVKRWTISLSRRARRSADDADSDSDDEEVGDDEELGAVLAEGHEDENSEILYASN